ncbi:MAG: VOC family protein [Gemmatimonadota bacterium]
MKPTFEKAFGYQGDALDLPVADVAAALPFYTAVLGFNVASESDGPPKRAVLERDGIQMAIVENGGDPTQDGCAFHVTQLELLFEEFKANGLDKVSANFDYETHDGNRFKVFYVVAPDGLCFWFGERQPE